MKDTLNISNAVYSRSIDNFGTIYLRHLDFERDLKIIHDWVTRPYASYWGMQNKSLEDVQTEYAKLVSIKNYDVFIGIWNDEPIFLMEKYKASNDRISQYYDVEDTDYGMHILVAPPKHKISGFTWNVFSTVIEYFFSQPYINRIVVEPDTANKKIHVLNKKAGFSYHKEIELPEKRAALAFCDRKQFNEAKRYLRTKLLPTNLNTNTDTQSAMTHLNPQIWKKANIALVCKAIGEFAHELILVPQKINRGEHFNTYRLVADIPEIYYEFNAKIRSLDHWDIQEGSITKYNNGKSKKIDAFEFIVEFRNTLKISEHLLPNYLEEISSTLFSAAYKLENQEFSSKELVKCSFQVIEHAMTEGHPCFVANNGRIGFTGEDYMKYAPETNQPFKLIWLAGHKSKTTYTATKKYEYKSLMHKELGVSTIARFNSKLEAKGLDFESYIFIPVHPWQWNNKILQIFSADIADQNLVFLGESEDKYTAQQSIRTLYNVSNPKKMYTKTALSILNMGFMRGLSPYYMKSTPHITDWITKLLANDNYLIENGFCMLGEVATVGFQNTYYEVLGKTNAHNKMLSALWRESPHCKVTNSQQLMTMAALLHTDKNEDSLLVAFINSSPFNTTMWLQKYLDAYLSPLLHCFYAYGFVFMPHGENIIMVLENNTPVKILMKDITEEVIVFNPELDLPPKVKRLYTETSDRMKTLTIFTDVFDCFFRFMSSILEKNLDYSEDLFWEQVAKCIHTYQARYPQLQSSFERYDLFVSEFDRCCLNRLQLKNTKQMLDLTDPIESLELVGTLKNPIAKFRNKLSNNVEKELQKL